MRSLIRKLSDHEKAVVLDTYIDEIEALEYGHIRGTNQILERFDEIAIEYDYLPCPVCKRGGKK